MPTPAVIALSVVVALLGSGLIATTVVLVLKKPPPTSCPPCDCYAEAVSDWKMTS
jgi:hypothetical protein